MGVGARKRSSFLAFGGFVLLVGVILANTFGVSNAFIPPEPFTNQKCLDCHNEIGIPNVMVEVGPVNPPEILPAHKRHFYSVMLSFSSNDPDGVSDTSFGCRKCHNQRTILAFEGDWSFIDGEGSGQDINKQVNAEVCLTCHGKFRTVASTVDGGLTIGQTITAHFDSARGDYVINTSPRGCTDNCHDGAGPGRPVFDATAHAAPTVTHITQMYASSSTYCLKCHGGFAWFQVEESQTTP